MGGRLAAAAAFLTEKVQWKRGIVARLPVSASKKAEEEREVKKKLLPLLSISQEALQKEIFNQD